MRIIAVIVSARYAVRWTMHLRRRDRLIYNDVTYGLSCELCVSARGVIPNRESDGGRDVPICPISENLIHPYRAFCPRQDETNRSPRLRYFTSGAGYHVKVERLCLVLGEKKSIVSQDERSERRSSILLFSSFAKNHAWDQFSDDDPRLIAITTRSRRAIRSILLAGGFCIDFNIGHDNRCTITSLIIRARDAYFHLICTK